VKKPEDAPPTCWNTPHSTPPGGRWDTQQPPTMLLRCVASSSSKLLWCGCSRLQLNNVWVSQGNNRKQNKLVSVYSVSQNSSPPPLLKLACTRQYPSYCDCLEVKREYYQNCSVLGCVTQCSQSAAHSCEQFLQVKQIGFVTLGPLRHA